MIQETLRLTFLKTPQLNFDIIRNNYTSNYLAEYRKYIRSAITGSCPFVNLNYSEASRNSLIVHKINEIMHTHIMRNLFIHLKINGSTLEERLIDDLLFTFISEYLD